MVRQFRGRGDRWIVSRSSPLGWNTTNSDWGSYFMSDATDLGQLELDSFGRWSALRDPSWNPELGVGYNHGLGYGDLPWGVHYSEELTNQLQEFWSHDGTTLSERDPPQ